MEASVVSEALTKAIIDTDLIGYFQIFSKLGEPVVGCQSKYIIISINSEGSI
jgi:hypothetical protein